MPVEILYDPARLLPPDDFPCQVSAPADYVPAVQQIKSALAGQANLQVLVTDPACAVWLERLAATYHTTQVRFTRKTVSQALAERWGVTVPDGLEEAILSSGVLALEVTPRSGQTFEDILLERVWGEFFAFPRFPVRYVGELVAGLDVDQWQANWRTPLYRQVLQQRQEQWLAAVQQSSQRKLIQAIFQEPAQTQARLAQYRLLAYYPPELSKALLGEWLAILKQIDVDASPLALEGPAVEEALREILYYLNNQAERLNSPEAYQALLAQVSGCLPQEFDWLLAHLRTAPELLRQAPELAQHIARKFCPIQDQIGAGLEALKRLAPPPYPSSPEANQTIDGWLAWAVQEYLPYRFWLEENDRWDETCAAYAGAYADWFYAHYNTHKYQEQGRWVFDLLNQTSKDLQNGRKVLFVVIDNFNFKYLDALARRFARWKFQPARAAQPVWSALPSMTAVSKGCLIAGKLEQVDIEESAYPRVLQEHFASYRVAYLPRLDAINQRSAFEEDLLLLNYLPIDEELHKDEKRIGATHSLEIEHYLNILVDALVQFVRRARAEDRVSIYVASDHGSTKISPDIPNPIDTKHYKKEAQNPHHRFIEVSDRRAASPTSYDEQHCYILPATVFGTHHSYFIPRGYGRFIAANESLYVHGGLTPEETIVPFLCFERSEVQVLPPTFRLVDNLLRLSVKAELTLVMGNPNPDDLLNLELRVKESDLPGVEIEYIPAGGSRQIALPVRVKQRPGVPALASITIQAAFEYQGRVQTLEGVTLAVVPKSISEDKTAFDFDF